MFQVPGESPTWHFVELVVAALTAAGSVCIPILIFVWTVKRSDRKANKELGDKRDAEQDRRHEENQAALAQINKTLEFNPPHGHKEDDDDGPSVPLMSGNIRYGPRRRM